MVPTAGGERELILSNRLHCHHQNDFRIKMGWRCGPFYCFINSAGELKTRDSAHQSQFLEENGKVSRSGESNLLSFRLPGLTTKPKPAHREAVLRSCSLFLGVGGEGGRVGGEGDTQHGMSW